MGHIFWDLLFQGEKNAIRDCTNWAWIAVDSRGFSQRNPKNWVSLENRIICTEDQNLGCKLGIASPRGF
jgi:hypothetical protein